MTVDQNLKFAQDAFDSRNMLDNAIDYISIVYNPEDIFSKLELELWACENGYVKESEIEENLG